MLCGNEALRVAIDQHSASSTGSKFGRWARSFMANEMLCDGGGGEQLRIVNPSDTAMPIWYAIGRRGCLVLWRFHCAYVPVDVEG